MATDVTLDRGGARVGDLVEDRAGDKAVVRAVHGGGYVAIEWDCRPGVASRVHESRLTNISERVRELDAEHKPSQPQSQWCPICKTFHRDVGEATDAGVATRACVLVPTDDPRYYGSAVYTGDR
jgi:hypothetical protein